MGRRFYVDDDEARQILISVVSISLAFTILYAGVGSLFKYTKQFMFFASLAVITVGSGFILHEMAHKIAATYYGAYARFQMWLHGILIMFLTSIFGFLFAAPGAVYIYSSSITKKENGIISLVGPIVNVLIAAIFVLLETVKPITFYFSFVRDSLHIWNFGAQINVILALFNMLPIFPLDGSKVFKWNVFVWAGFILLAMAFGYFVFGSIGIIYTFGTLLVISLILSRMIF